MLRVDAHRPVGESIAAVHFVGDVLMEVEQDIHALLVQLIDDLLQHLEIETSGRKELLEVAVRRRLDAFPQNEKPYDVHSQEAQARELGTNGVELRVDLCRIDRRDGERQDR